MKVTRLVFLESSVYARADLAVIRRWREILTASSFLINGKPNDVTVGAGRPFPVILPLAPRSKTDFNTFDPLTSQTVQVTFNLVNGGSVASLTVRSKNGDIVAKKVR